MRANSRQYVRVQDVDQARAILLDALRADACRISEGNTRVIATRGSQLKVRLLGGAMLSIKSLPVRLEVDFTIEKDGRAGLVEMVALDDFGFGTTIGMNSRNQQAVDDLMSTALRVLSPLDIGNVDVPKTKRVKGQSKSFCSECGEALVTGGAFCSSCGSRV